MAQDSAAPVVKRLPPYEADYYSWLQEQVALLRAGRFAEIDAENIAEELSDVAKSEFRALQSAIAVLAQHLLKWDHQPDRRSRSWVLTVTEQRLRIADILAESPGLKHRLADAFASGYRYGRLRALEEAELAGPSLPAASPYVWSELMEKPVHLPGFDVD